MAGLVCLSLFGTVGPAVAQSDDENARRHFESGAAYLQHADYENALREFTAAYKLSKRPELLLNIATVNERMGEPQAAIDALKEYLSVAPDTADRATVESRIANLRKSVRARAAASASAAAEAAPASSGSAAPKPPPAPNRTAAYVVGGVGLAAAAGAVVTAIVAKSKFSDADKNCKPHCTDAEVASIKRWAVTNTVLTGVAIVGVGVGAVLYFTAKPPESAESASLVPHLDAVAGPSGAQVEATWHF